MSIMNMYEPDVGGDTSHPNHPEYFDVTADMREDIVLAQGLFIRQHLELVGHLERLGVSWEAVFFWETEACDFHLDGIDASGSEDWLCKQLRVVSRPGNALEEALDNAVEFAQAGEVG